MCLKVVNYMAKSGPDCRNNFVGTSGKVISILFGINGVINKWSHLVGPPFPVFKAHFSFMAGWYFSRVLIGSLLIGGCG